MKKIVYIVIAVLFVIFVSKMFWKSTETKMVSGTSTFADSSYFKGEVSSALGKYLADKNGKTLYTFTKDTPGTSNCAGDCIIKWPAYGPSTAVSEKLPQNVSTITRLDGTVQFTWKDMPLYYFVSDMKAGDTTGQGVGGFWYVVNY